MNKLFLFILSFLLSTYGWSANRYVVAAGGNSNSTATWSETSGGAGGASVPIISDDVFLDSASGRLTINTTFFCKSFNCTGFTNTLTVNNVGFTIDGSLTLVSGMTFVSNTSTSINISANGTVTTGGKLLFALQGNSGVTITLGDNLGFLDSKNTSLQISSSGSLNMNGKSISGFSSTSRTIVRSETLGSLTSISNATTSFANCDFRDIQFSSASDLDLSGITGGSGDCGGNSITGGGTVLTFTTPATQTATMSTDKNWSDVTIWTSRVPLPQDDVSLAGVTGGTLAADMPRLGKTIDWTGASGSPKWSIGDSDLTLYGGLTLISGMTVTGNTKTITFEGRGAYTLTSAGKEFPNGQVCIASVGGSITLQDAFSLTGTFYLLNGTFDTNGNTMSQYGFSGTGTTTRALYLRSSTINLTGADYSRWSMDVVTGLTFDAGTSTITFLSNTGSPRYFTGGGLTYYNFVASAGLNVTKEIEINNSNTFNNITLNAPIAVKFQAGRNQTVGSFTAVGTAVNGISLYSDTPGTPAKLSDASGMNLLKYCTIKDITATGGATWLSLLAMGNVNVSGNTGWIWNAGLGIIMIND